MRSTSRKVGVCARVRLGRRREFWFYERTIRCPARTPRSVIEDTAAFRVRAAINALEACDVECTDAEGVAL